ncbi:VOC family protein [Nocardioides sp. WL0053]|uniref:VOC family protein n=1 Tax=Nocardioides jiangsuensis TaxID=2866161 RepID=A0ABS7RLB9_9ACTN|nr:VOC family protein [Nocardioides jiangsuensis]MBY9075843.1 VOC family protein [Nocardioides jiangsuensis]
MTDAVPPNFSIVTLGVTDLERSVRFYTDLGWEQRGNITDGIVWFKTSGTWLGLFGYDALADDAHLEAPPQDELPRYRGITLAVNLPDEAAVDLAFVRVREVGGKIVKPATRAEWGGYSGYFSDPDGILWEIAYAPGFAVDEHGRIEVP